MPSVSLEPALEALRSGEIIGVPTDTVYGIAADPMQRSAVERLFTAKRRPGIKPIPILVASIEDARRIAVIDEGAAATATRHWPGGLTLILPRVVDLPDWVGDSQRNTVGVRIPNHAIALQLLAVSGPLAVTSANRSGADPAIDRSEAEEALGDSVAAYLPGRGSGGAASTVVDLSGAKPRTLRKGPVDWAPS